jgi:predicted DsbA family dithiol-disulfide isomerase
MRTLRIDIIADVVCPWCEIGYRRLLSALNAVNTQIHPDIHWHPYELNPVLPQEGINLHHYLQKRYQLSASELTHRIEHIITLAKEAGFIIKQNSDSRIYNTRRAHQLLLWSTAIKSSEQLRQKICAAYFCNNANISSEPVLVAIGNSVGIETEKVKDVIHDKAWEAAVVKTEKQWLDAGINKTPTIIFEQSHIMSGVKTQAEYEDYIHQLLPELRYIH